MDGHNEMTDPRDVVEFARENRDSYQWNWAFNEIRSQVGLDSSQTKWMDCLLAQTAYPHGHNFSYSELKRMVVKINNM